MAKQKSIFYLLNLDDLKQIKKTKIYTISNIIHQENNNLLCSVKLLNNKYDAKSFLAHYLEDNLKIKEFLAPYITSKTKEIFSIDNLINMIFKTKIYSDNLYERLKIPYKHDKIKKYIKKDFEPRDIIITDLQDTISTFANVAINYLNYCEYNKKFIKYQFTSISHTINKFKKTHNQDLKYNYVNITNECKIVFNKLIAEINDGKIYDHKNHWHHVIIDEYIIFCKTNDKTRCYMLKINDLNTNKDNQFYIICHVEKIQNTFIEFIQTYNITELNNLISKQITIKDLSQYHNHIASKYFSNLHRIGQHCLRNVISKIISIINCYMTDSMIDNLKHKPKKLFEYIELPKEYSKELYINKIFEKHVIINRRYIYHIHDICGSRLIDFVIPRFINKMFEDVDLGNELGNNICVLTIQIKSPNIMEYIYLSDIFQEYFQELINEVINGYNDQYYCLKYLNDKLLVHSNHV